MKNYLLNFGEFIKKGKRHHRKQRSRSRKLLRRSLSSNIPSRKNDSANIQINRETAINNLKNLEKVMLCWMNIRTRVVCYEKSTTHFL